MSNTFFSDHNMPQLLAIPCNCTFTNNSNRIALKIFLLPPTKEEVNIFALVCLCVCLSVCLLARLLKNACIDLDEMLRVDRRRDMDELINF